MGFRVWGLGFTAFVLFSCFSMSLSFVLLFNLHNLSFDAGQHILWFVYELMEIIVSKTAFKFTRIGLCVSTVWLTQKVCQNGMMCDLRLILVGFLLNTEVGAV